MADPQFHLLVAVVLLTLVFDFVNGFHDTANAIATVVSTNVLPPRTAVILAALFNFLGAFLGTGVAKTIGGDIADPTSVTQTVVLAALFGVAGQAIFRPWRCSKVRTNSEASRRLSWVPVSSQAKPRPIRSTDRAPASRYRRLMSVISSSPRAEGLRSRAKSTTRWSYM